MSQSKDELYDVCIVGAGIGGLATALALQQQGVRRILVVERDLHFFDRKQGYGLTLTNSLTGPLARLGLLDQCIEKNCKSQSHYTFNAAGEILGYYGRILEPSHSQQLEQEQLQGQGHEQHKSMQGGSRGNLRVPRQELRQLMLDRLAANNDDDNINNSQVTLCWGHRLVQYDELDSHVVMTFSIIGTPAAAESSTVSTTTTTTVTRRASVLLGADGIRSAVRVLRDEMLSVQHQSPLTYLGVSVMIGIAPFSHPLLSDQGFYVLDGQNRIFTMPYYTPGDNDDYHIAQKCRPLASPLLLSSTTTPTTTSTSSSTSTSLSVDASTPYVMWQLSFSGLSEQDALALKNKSFAEILNAASQQVQHMFPAVQSLVQQTVHSGEVWATPLYDRDDLHMHARGCGTRVTMLGDAAHPMCMFKGQGANQALEDAPLFATYLATGLSLRQWDQQQHQQYKSRKRPHSMDNALSQNDHDVFHTNNHDLTQDTSGSISLEGVPRATLLTRLRNFEREMVARAGAKVRGARQSAKLLHSPQALNESVGIGGLDEVIRLYYRDGDGDQQSQVPVKELEAKILPVVLQRLKDQGITAHLGDSLDSEFRRVVMDTVQELLRTHKSVT
jgi:salicylate hydroxylase